MAAFEKFDSVLGVAFTGAGKTIVIARIIKRRTDADGKRVMVIAHREELIDQAAHKIGVVTGEAADVEMGMRHADMQHLFRTRAVCASVQTLCAGRAKKFFWGEFSTLIIDEAHHALADSYRRIIAHAREANPSIKVFGVTATADRSDKLAMGEVFDHVAFKFDIDFGVSEGWLVEPIQHRVKVLGLDLSRCRTTAGDLNGKDLANVMEYERNLQGVVSSTIDIVGDKRSIVFCASIAQAERTTEIFNRHRAGSAKLVTGATDKDIRRRTFTEFDCGDFNTLVNVGVATEGFDQPKIEAVVIARPTKSRSLYTQMVGRGFRPLEGVVDAPHLATAALRREAITSSAKPHAMVLDFVGNSGTHKLVSMLDVLGGDALDDKSVAEIEYRASTGRGANVMDEIAKAKAAMSEARRQQEIENEREKHRRRSLVQRFEFTTETVDPFIHLDIKPNKGPPWMRAKPATEPQIRFLRWKNVPIKRDMTMGEASVCISIIKKREAAGEPIRKASTGKEGNNAA